MSWITNALLALVLLTPAMPLVPLIAKLGLRPEGFIAAFYLGVALGMPVVSGAGFSFVSPIGLFGAVIGAGLVLGALGNYFFAQALVLAPNVGLPYALVGLASVGAYLLSAFLSTRFPEVFPLQEFNLTNFLGLALIALGVGLAMWR